LVKIGLHRHYYTITRFNEGICRWYRKAAKVR
jgi:hypothetical protein